jgi:uncharacterized membrane protein
VDDVGSFREPRDAALAGPVLVIGHSVKIASHSGESCFGHKTHRSLEEAKMKLRFPPDARAHQHPANSATWAKGRSRRGRIADAVAASVGSWPFIPTQSVLLALWIITNGFLLRDWIGQKPFDPYPFILLNLVLSFQAAYTGPVVLMSQNRQAARDRDEAEHDHEVNRDAIEILRRIQKDQRHLEELLQEGGG